ncbi:MAG: PEP-CTERM sorting domain-containing protein, partial [Planctomycetaceae bacterium]|nr:PEP-CTERM sorting domain-containing protein [Planctomycetaceae bacterium]
RFWAKNALFVKIPLQIVTPKNNDANRNSETKWVFSGTTIYTIVASMDGVTANVIPEPATLAIVGLGLVGLGWARRQRK